MKQSSILIVEDEAPLREVYELVLERQGYRVETAQNGLEGLRLLRKKQFDIVLLDIFMPVMDGKELLKNIDTTEFPATKFIACSNLSDKETENEMLALGAHMFVLKSSMAPRDLVSLVDRLVASR